MTKTVLITGSSKGIGNALANLFSSNGYSVIGTSRKEASNYAEASNVQMFQLNLADTKSIETFVGEIKKQHIKLDVLINNAAVGTDLGTNIPEENSFKETFDTNVTGTVLLTEQLLDIMNVHSKIINVSSKMGSIGICSDTDSVAYRMSKAALNMYSKILANRLGEKITVATIHPGWVRTGLTQDNANAPLSKEESAAAIFSFVESNFKTGIYWNAIEQKEMEW
jgi:NAD(P)-dependent dehydrogenase (short-subunit alcohol dehydrogenase family)